MNVITLYSKTGNNMGNLVEISKLKPNPWNTNSLTRSAEDKLDESIRRNGMFKPVVVRELPDGMFEIIGGQHRWESCKRLKIKKIPIHNIGQIDDIRAKEISVLDNGRYGTDDIVEFGNLLREIGNPSELAEFMPITLEELASLEATSKIDFDNLEDEGEEELPVQTPSKKSIKTHVTMRFTITVENHGFVEKAIAKEIKSLGLNDPDSQINAGDALMSILRERDFGA